MKSGMGQPGSRLLFAGRREEATRAGKRLVCMHTDPVLKLSVESVYEAFDGVPVVRRYSRVTNDGSSPVGLEFLSSAMLHGLAAPQEYDRELRIHLAQSIAGWLRDSGIPSGLQKWALSKTSGQAGRKRRQEASAVGPQSGICPWPWQKTRGWG